MYSKISVEKKVSKKIVRKNIAHVVTEKYQSLYYQWCNFTRDQSQKLDDVKSYTSANEEKFIVWWIVATLKYA